MIIPINLAIRAVKINIAMRDAAAAWPMGRMNGMGRDDVAFILAAHAGYKAALEYLLADLEAMEGAFTLPHHKAAVRPLVEHLDQTRPGWRTE